ncbi:hypothetical protein [Streptomyces sp. NPDC058683]|uniref:hypothetical protein n=1 Tax=Streptomyces sp. NPDC058683 TaxID=3346597 RepID=UPI003653247D
MEDLADLYVESSDTAAGEEHHNRPDFFLRRLMDGVRRPGLAMLVAQTSTLLGCAFGSVARRDGSWWQGLKPTLPQHIQQLTTSGRVFAITGTVVHPHHKDRDFTRRPQERLLADQPRLARRHPGRPRARLRDAAARRAGMSVQERKMTTSQSVSPVHAHDGMAHDRQVVSHGSLRI